MKTLYLGPDELMLAAKISVGKGATGSDIADVIDAAEESVRNAVPAARVIYLEPDIKIVVRKSAAKPAAQKPATRKPVAKKKA